jgi:predicted enzyme related to lactoylglutathione lyase
MAERTKYAPGTFSWTDLTTTDQDGAKSFYMELFGWEAEDRPAGEGIVYSMMKLDGEDVAAISPQPEQQREAGAPPMWNSYITVRSADEALSRAAQLGATVHAPAFDVFDAGRMGVVQDPQGAYFLVWEPKDHIGAALVNAPGALSWNELASPDLDGSAAFYGDLFGWTTEPLEEAPMPYLIIKNSDGRTNGSMRPTMPPDSPPFWLVYFGIDDLDAGLAKIGELGGSTIAEPMDVGPGGRIAVAQDPQRALFALYAGSFED